MNTKENSLRGNDLLELGERGHDFRNEKNFKMDINKNILNFNFIEGKRDVLQVSYY